LLALLVVQTVLTMSVGAALGWRFTGSLPAPVLALLLGGVAFGALGLLIAGTLRAEGTLAAANALFVVLVAVSGVAYPLERGPDALTAIAGVLPSGALGEALRAALGSPGEVAVRALLVLLAWAVAAIAAAARWTHWEP
jgi:ABC-2 type transport system permease protein